MRCVRTLWLLAVLSVVALALGTISAQAASSWRFVTHQGSKLYLGGQVFRFAGANIEWLGLVGYGPLNFEPGQTERFPTHYEVNDALATAKEMGANVVRAQTLGDTVGCPNCLEPKLGVWNAKAFRVMDYAIMRARHYGIRLILEFQGDSRAVNGGNNTSVYSDWEKGASFYSSPAVISDFEAHIRKVIDHVNSYTGVAYKNDPTILGWMDCNDCGAPDPWVEAIDGYMKSLAPDQLTIDNSALLAPDPNELADPQIDAFAPEVYPHWVPEADGDKVTGVDPLVDAAAALSARYGHAFFASEYGWDATDWSTPTALNNYLTSMRDDPNVSGDLFWALEGHANGHGWTPIPADSDCTLGALDSSAPNGDVPSIGPLGCITGEDGSWWALYYTGIPTAANTAADMAARAQIIRTNAYEIRGLAVPPHMVPPAPIITATAAGKLYWEGSAGAKDYSIEGRGSGGWSVLCNQCVTDMNNGWGEPRGVACFRVVAYNLGDVPGPASAPAGSGCRRSALPAARSARSKKTPPVCPASRWVVSWEAPPGDADSAFDPRLVPFVHGPEQTLRMIITPHYGGSEIRVQLSNRFGQGSVTFNAVSLAVVKTGATLVPGTSTPVTFNGGYTMATAAAGTDIVSDPVKFRFASFETLAVSIYVADPPSGLPTEHFTGRQTSFGTNQDAGDQVANPSAVPFTQSTTSRYYLDGLDVLAPGDAGTVVAFGDSLTDGYQGGPSLVPENSSTDNLNARYPDWLQRRIKAADLPLSVANAGISGNLILKDGSLPMFGPPGLDRFHLDALDQPGVSTVIILEGANDLGGGETAPQIIAGLTKLVAMARATGVQVLLGTLTPMEDAFLPDYSGATVNAARLAVNAWIEGQHLADGVINFSAAVADPTNPDIQAPAYNGGDGLHYTPAGYRAMAAAIPLSDLKGPPCVTRKVAKRKLAKRRSMSR